MILKITVFSQKEIFVFEPPNPITKFYYKCDRKFHLDDLIKLYQKHSEYAIILISGKRTEFYLHTTNNTKCLKRIDEKLPNQHKTGGQSAVRFERNRDEKISWYIKKIAETNVNYYVNDGKFKYKGVIIAGPAEMKKLLKDNEIFKKYFMEYLIKSVTISEIVDNSIYNVINMANDVLNGILDDNILFGNLEDKISNSEEIDLLVFGTDEILTMLKKGELSELYIYNLSLFKDDIIKLNSKTKIIIINNKIFNEKYGEMIGIKYYANNSVFTELIEDTDELEIIEV